MIDKSNCNILVKVLMSAPNIEFTATLLIHFAKCLAKFSYQYAIVNPYYCTTESTTV